MIKFYKIFISIIFILSFSNVSLSKENFFDEGIKLFKNKKSFFLSPEYFYLNKEIFKKYLKNTEHFYFNTFNKNNHINIDVNIIHNLSSIKKEIDFSFINQYFKTQQL